MLRDLEDIDCSFSVARGKPRGNLRIDIGIADRAVDGISDKIEHRIGINESNAHLAASVAGLGIVQTFAHAANAALQDGSLAEILKKWRPPLYPFHVVYPQNRYVTHRLRVFVDWLPEFFPARVRGIG